MINNNEQLQWDDKSRRRRDLLPIEVREHLLIGDPYWSHVPTGWRQLVVDLHTLLVGQHPEYAIHQIKEKFGGLVFHTDVEHNNNELGSIIIQHYESLSKNVCDVCGSRGKTGPTATGWLATRCVEHASPPKE